MKRGEVWWINFEPAVGGEVGKERPAVIGRPGEVAPDRSADLELVTRAHVVGEIRRDLASFDAFNGQLQHRLLRRGGDGVGALRLVAVVGREPDVDVLPGEVRRPVRDVHEQRACVWGLDPHIANGGDAPPDGRPQSPQ